MKGICSLETVYNLYIDIVGTGGSTSGWVLKVKKWANTM